MEISELKEIIDQRLIELTQTKPSFFSSLHEGARYSLSSGKRLRPLLTLAAVEMFQKNGSKAALDAACALEMIHTYSLIHDDLPCMDDDDFRRGKPSLHKAYSESHAVLVGDYLLTRAFEVIALSQGISSPQKIALISALTKGAGCEGMIGGQVMDLQNVSHKTESYVDELILRKTSALFRTSLEIAGIIMDAEEALMRKLAHFGTLFGSLFQIIDDLIDGDYPLGYEKALKKLHYLESETYRALSSLEGESSQLKELVDRALEQVKNVL